MIHRHKVLETKGLVTAVQQMRATGSPSHLVSLRETDHHDFRRTILLRFSRELGYNVVIMVEPGEVS